MKKIILAIAALLTIAISAQASPNVFRDADGNAYRIEGTMVFEISEEEAERMEAESTNSRSKVDSMRGKRSQDSEGRTLKLEYVKVRRDFMTIGLRASHKGSVTCRALNGSQTVSINTWTIENEFTKVIISGAAGANRGTCSYNN